MTREEAIEVVELALLKINGIPNAGRDYAHIRRQAEIDVDCNVALGMLKLDEPKSVLERYYETASEYFNSSIEANEFKLVLEEAGLKIVEK